MFFCGNGTGRSFNLIVCLFGLGLLVSGCASIPGYPKPINEELNALVYCTAFSSNNKKKSIKTTSISEGGCSNLNLKTADRDKRDEVVYKLLRASDEAFEVYKRKLYKEGVSFDLATDISRLGLEAAAAVTGGPGMKSALSATAGGLGAVQASVDKRVYFEQTLTAIIQLMMAKRNEILADIYRGLSKDVDEYPLGMAIRDIQLYHSSGSIPEALAEVVKEAKTRAEKAEEEVNRVIELKGAPPDEKVIAQKVQLGNFLETLSDAQLKLYALAIDFPITGKSKIDIADDIKVGLLKVKDQKDLDKFLKPFSLGGALSNLNSDRLLHNSQSEYLTLMNDYIQDQVTQGKLTKLNAVMLFANCWGVATAGKAAGQIKSDIDTEIGKKGNSSKLTTCRAALDALINQ